MRNAAFVIGTLAAIGGCSLFTELGDFASEDPSDGGATMDAANADRSPDDDGAVASDSATLEDAGAIADADATVDADAGLVNLHPHGTFEQGCGAWGFFKATLASSTESRTGAASCLVCTDGTDTYFTADDNGAIPDPIIGAEYLAEVWVRTAPGKPVPPDFGLTLRTRNDNPFEQPEAKGSTNDVPVSATWQKLSVKLPVTLPAQTLNVVVGTESAGGACFLLDDVAVYRTK